MFSSVYEFVQVVSGCHTKRYKYGRAKVVSGCKDSTQLSHRKQYKNAKATQLSHETIQVRKGQSTKTSPVQLAVHVVLSLIIIQLSVL